jgi:hypothetical protein
MYGVRDAWGTFRPEWGLVEYVVVYKGRNWPSDRDGPNVAMTVVRGDEYFQFYIALFPPGGALDLMVDPGPTPHRVSDRCTRR